ncbi:UPF0213 protein YazA [Bacillus safensis]|uniref:UPF0213 protein YazA n=1 Tax=Bacillus safensis TaxID=561879 RepID=A0A5S9M4M4_BACIA|nr:UPF0213 protein YazA [Bacillus safensis]
MEKHNHYFYVLKCADGSLYAGYTNDLQKRLMTPTIVEREQSIQERDGRLSFFIMNVLQPKREAMQQEYRFKTWTRKKKDIYIEEMRIEKRGGT